MSRNWRLVLLGVLLLAALCCCLTTLGLARIVFRQAGGVSLDIPTPYVPREPTPVLKVEQRSPTDAERDTERLLARSSLPMRDLIALARRLQQNSEPMTNPTPGGPPDYQIGDSLIFWVRDPEANAFYTSTATLEFATPHSFWWVEQGYQIPDRDLKRSAQRFEERTYPTNRRLFGSEWTPGVDGDPHVYVFLGPISGVAGYYSSPDEYSALVRPYSNEHEVFYINLDDASPGTDYFDGVLAHEFLHMIHWAMDRDEDSWVNEGLAELAALVNGYDVGSSEVQFVAAPDTQLTTWSQLESSGPHYGASYLFLAYFWERYGDEAVRRLVAEPANGIAGFDAVLAETDPAHPTFEDVFADWVVANYLEDKRVTGGDYGYAGLSIDRPSLAARHTTYPVEEKATVHQHAADYIVLEGEVDVTIGFTGTVVVPIVGNEAHSGDFFWWSNRGDSGDASLTRAFDLTALGQATLDAWLWYDLEEDYDYAYVEVSTDDGETWTPLANADTTTFNPSGNSYGPALTGTSGGGSEPDWVRASFDLTPFAGQPVLVRFEVVTDESLNHPGVCVDDISVPELGYVTDVEKDEGGWRPEGWVRVTDHVPQEFLVQLISVGREIRVEQMSLDGQMQGTVSTLGLGEEIDHAILVVSGMTPSTTEWAAYSYTVRRK